MNTGRSLGEHIIVMPVFSTKLTPSGFTRVVYEHFLLSISGIKGQPFIVANAAYSLAPNKQGVLNFRKLKNRGCETIPNNSCQQGDH